MYAEEESLVRSSKDKVSQCGIVEVPLVIGGSEAAPKEFPHTVRKIRSKIKSIFKINCYRHWLVMDRVQKLSGNVAVH